MNSEFPDAPQKKQEREDDEEKRKANEIIEKNSRRKGGKLKDEKVNKNISAKESFHVSITRNIECGYKFNNWNIKEEQKEEKKKKKEHEKPLIVLK